MPGLEVGGAVRGVAVGDLEVDGDRAVGTEGQDPEDLLEIGAMVLVVSEGGEQRGFAPHALAGGELVLALQGDAGRIVVELFQTDVELANHEDDEIRQLRVAIRVEEAVEGAADTVIIEQAQLLWLEAHQGGHALRQSK
jgi:hypothetical protein